MILADQPVHTTVAGELIVFVLFPLLVLAIAGMGAFCIWVVKQITLHSGGLALLVQDVRPVEGPSLRTLVEGLTVDVAVIKAQPSNHPGP